MWAHTKKHHIDKAKRIDTYEDDDLPMSAGEAIKKIVDLYQNGQLLSRAYVIVKV